MAGILKAGLAAGVNPIVAPYVKAAVFRAAAEAGRQCERCFFVHTGILAARGKHRLGAVKAFIVIIQCSLSNIHSYLL